MLENNSYYKPTNDTAIDMQWEYGARGYLQKGSLLVSIVGLAMFALYGVNESESLYLYLGLGFMILPMVFLWFQKILSAPLQIFASALNTVSVFIIALCYLGHMHEGMELLGWISFGISGVLILMSRAWTLLAYIARILVGGLFIVSGMIKANDPEGFAFKLHDYFQEDALNLESWNDYAIYMAIIIAVGEIVLGFAAIVGGKMRVTAWTLLIMILSFTGLTYYTGSCLDTQKDYNDIAAVMSSADNSLTANAPEKLLEAEIKYDYLKKALNDIGGDYQDSLSTGYDEKLALASQITTELEKIEAMNLDSASKANKMAAVIQTHLGKSETLVQMHELPPFWRQCVDDCGCFGDALKGSVGRSLKPWESFAKDAVLLYFVLLLFALQGRIKLNTPKEDMFLVLSSLVVVTFLCIVFDNWYFPLIFSILLFIVYVFLKRMKLGKIGVEWSYAIIVTLASLGVSLYTYSYLPMKDYRPYSVGSNLVEKFSDGIEPDIEKTFVCIDRETKEKVEISQDEYMANWKEVGQKYIIITSFDKEISAGRNNSISDFQPVAKYGDLPHYMKNDGQLTSGLFDPSVNPKYMVLYMEEYDQNDTVLLEDYQRDKEEYYPDSVYTQVGEYQKQPSASTDIQLKDYILSKDVVLLVVARELDKVREGAMADLVSLTDAAMAEEIPTICLTASGQEMRQELRDNYSFNAMFATADGTELKIVVRSNPGVVLVSNGVVMGKWSSRSIPSLGEIKNSLSK